jgi:beta-glucosidase-like glycosyl hydrolase
VTYHIVKYNNLLKYGYHLNLPSMHAGSVLSGGGSVPAKNAPPEAWAKMVNGMQGGALSTRLGIPIIYGIDAVHGHGNVYKATIFPHNVGLGCTRYR